MGQDEEIRAVARTLSRNEVLLLSATRFWSQGRGQTLWRGVLSVLHKQGIKAPAAEKAAASLQARGWVVTGGKRSAKTIGLTSAGFRASEVISRGVELLPWDWRSTFPDEQRADPRADAIRAYQESIGMAHDPRKAPNPPLAIIGEGLLGNPHQGIFCWNCRLALSGDQDICPRCSAGQTEAANPSRVEVQDPLQNAEFLKWAFSNYGMSKRALEFMRNTDPKEFAAYTQGWADPQAENPCIPCMMNPAPGPTGSDSAGWAPSDKSPGRVKWERRPKGEKRITPEGLWLHDSSGLMPEGYDPRAWMFENPQEDLDLLVRQARTGDVEAYRKYVREAVRRGILEKSLGTMSHGWGKSWTPEVSAKRSGHRADGFFYLPWSGDDYRAMQNPLTREESEAALAFANHQQKRALNMDNSLTLEQRRDLMWRAAGAGDIVDLYSDFGAGAGMSDPANVKLAARAARLGTEAMEFSKAHHRVGGGKPIIPEIAPRRKNPTDKKRKGDRGKKVEISLDEARKFAKQVGQEAAFEAAMRAHKKFHGVWPDKVTVYRFPDGGKKINRKFVAGLGRVPETHYYKSHPDGNKANTYWVHKHPPGGEPLEVLDPATGVTSKIGGTFKVTSWWYH